MLPISVIILTKNEELFINRCIKSVLWADEVLVLDSGSTDKTKEIAISLGANVYDQEWLGYASQRNRGSELAKNDWVFFVDADELVTPELARSIQKVMSGSVDERDGYSVNRRGDFYGILLPNTSNRKRRLGFVRMFNRRYSGFDPSTIVHEEMIYPGKPILLDGILIHWRAYMMDGYITSANRYATMEAEMLDRSGCRSSGFLIFLRTILRFLWCYIARGGIFLGTRGLIHAMLHATSEYIRYAKLWEMQNVTCTLHPPTEIYSDPPITTKSNDVVGIVK
jgi:(heptosyl)LPS beta-1,4-glucosyltransferase